MRSTATFSLEKNLRNKVGLMKKSKGRLLGRLAMRFYFEPLRWLKQMRLPKVDQLYGLNGYKLHAFPPRENKISQYIYEHGVWEPEVTEFAKSVIKPGMHVWDIGADVGYFTLLFSQLVGSSGGVTAFEPIPKARVRLQENLRLNNRNNVQIEDRALGRTPGKFILEKPLSVSRVNFAKSKPEQGDIEVAVVRADDLAGQWPIPDIIKMDVEGAEFEILQGMDRLLIEHRPSLILELHGPYLPLFGTTAERVVAWLEAKNYKLTPIDQPDMQWNVRNTTVWATTNN